jgi:hydrogenase expression/formation protein HypE
MLQCPSPATINGQRITLAHGEGARAARRLLDEHVFSILGPSVQHARDAARLPTLTGEMAFTTDSFVVSPLFFPGGDIGKLAVCGTANDLSVSGAQPRWLSLSLIVEEGFSLETFDAILRSIAAAARETCLEVVTGDTKVVPRGAADGMFITTAGIGEIIMPALPGSIGLEIGDELVVSGPIGRHGIAVLAAREQMQVDLLPASDCGPLMPAVDALHRANLPVVAMRDATRGGVGAVLHEWAGVCGHALAICENQLPVTDDVRGISELLGLDPLHIANEGTMLIAVRPGFGANTAAVLESIGFPGASVIGRVQARAISPVLVERGLGRAVPLDEPIGAPLPRIC